MSDGSDSNNIPILTLDELNQLHTFKKARDIAALKIGVGTIELENLKNQQMQVINNSMHTEIQFANNIARRFGINPDKVNFSIDYETGKILITGNK